MKKFLALIVACMIVASSYAAPMYSSEEYMDAAPVLMKGTLKLNSWEVADCALDKEKASFQVYLAFCQPCINCIECSEVEELANVQLYIVEKVAKTKTVYLTAVDLPDLDVLFTTGKQDIAKKGEVKLDMIALSQDTYGDVAPFYLTGAWNQKTWFSGLDLDSNKEKHKVILGAIQKLDGNVSSENTTDSLWACGTLALRRDDSATKSLMLIMTEDSKGGKTKNPFLQCVPGKEPEIDTCAKVMTLNEDEEEVGAEDLESSVGAYILKKAVPKKYTLYVNGVERK